MSNEHMHADNEALQDDIVTLVSEDGQEQDFLILGDFDFEDKAYAVLSDKFNEAGEVADDADIIMLQIVDEDGEDVLYEIEDDEEWSRVVEYWNSLGEEE